MHSTFCLSPFMLGHGTGRVIFTQTMAEKNLANNQVQIGLKGRGRFCNVPFAESDLRQI